MKNRIIHYIFQKIKYIKKDYFIEIVILSIITAILANTLFVYPVIGKCDNGDFSRFYMYGGLSGLSNEYSKMYDGYVHLKYSISNLGLLLPFGPNWVSGVVILKVAVIISILVHGSFFGLFDIRYLALVYSIVFLYAVFLIIRNAELTAFLKIAAGIFIILFFTDTVYISYFNSFFGEAGVIVFFFMNIGAYILLISKSKPNKRHFSFFFLASGAFLTSKSQELPLLIFMLGIYSGLYFYYKEERLRKTIICGTLAVVMLCGCSYFSISRYTNYNNEYQSVFSGILINSKTKEKDLEELGVDKSLQCFSGVSFYDRKGKNDPLSDKMLKDFYPKASSIRVLGFYLKHLDRLWLRVQDSAQNTYSFYQLHKGNFVKGEFTANKYVNNFRLTLIKKYPYLHRNIYFFIIFSLLFFFINICYMIICKDRYVRLLSLMLLFILAAGDCQFVLPVIGSGECDFAKHLFLTNLCFDTMLGIALLWILYIIKISCNLFMIRLTKSNIK